MKMLVWLVGMFKYIKNIFTIVLGGIIVYLLRRNSKLKENNNNLKEEVIKNEKVAKRTVKIVKILSENSNRNLDGNIERMRRDEL